MNEYSKELCHWGIELGAKRDNHKYIARVETRPGKYLYFYDMAKYNAWKSGAKNKIQTLGKQAKEKTADVKNRVTPSVNNIRSKVNSVTRVLAAKTAAKRTKVEDAANKYANYISTKAASGASKVRSAADSRVDIIKKNLDAGKKSVLDTASNARAKAEQRMEAIKNRYDEGRNALLVNARQHAGKLSNLSKKSIDTGKSIAINAKTQAETAATNAIKSAKSFIEKKASAAFKGDQNQSDILDAKNYASHFLKATMEQVGEGSYNILHRREKHPMEASIKKAPSGSNYLAEISYPDGTTAKIKDKDQWEHFSEIVKYQQNEQSFMHSIPEIKVRSDGTMPSKEEDSAEVNDKRGDEDSKFRTVNCIYCSTAYELRRRGYDVEAADLPSTVTATNISQLYDMKDSTVKRKTKKLETDDPMSSAGLYGTIVSSSVSKKDGKTKYQYEVSYADLDNHDKNIKSFTMIDTMKSARNTTSKDFAKQANKQLNETAKDFPNGSRGMINVYWQFGGGHSMVWEKDEKGNLTIYDTQKNEKLDSAEMMQSVDPFTPIMMVRTDDAKLSKKALTKIRSN